MTNEELDALFEEIMSGWWKDHPLAATYMGIHYYDHLLGNIDKETREFLRKKDERYYKRLREFEKSDKLTRDQIIDLKLLVNNYEIDFYIDEKLKPYERFPSIVPNIAMGGLHIFMIRDFAPLNTKLENMLSRMRQIPQLVKEGKANMMLGGETIPPLWVDMANEEIEGGAALFDVAIPEYGKQAPLISSEINEECERAKNALQSYKEFLAEEIRPKAKGQYAVGKEIYNYLLRKQYQLPYDADKLLEIGKKIKAETEMQLASIASEIQPGKTYAEVMDNLKGNYPPKEKIKDFYREETANLRKFIVEKKIVDIPDGESLSIIDTPSFHCATIPYAAYMPPAPFESAQVGNFYVTPINPALPPDQQEDQLEGHNRYKAVLTTVHEGYPGHHLQLVYANKVQSKMRKIFGDGVFVEGWALYCEEMMRDVGYITDKRIALFQLRDQLWRACRVIIDVGLHTGNMTFDQAVEMLVEVAHLERTNAISEAKRYTESPTQPMSYTVGKLMIKQLKEDYKKKMDKKYTLKGFHNRLLSYGSLPLKIIREEMLDQ